MDSRVKMPGFNPASTLLIHVSKGTKPCMDSLLGFLPLYKLGIMIVLTHVVMFQALHRLTKSLEFSLIISTVLMLTIICLMQQFFK